MAINRLLDFSEHSQTILWRKHFRIAKSLNETNTAMGERTRGPTFICPASCEQQVLIARVCGCVALTPGAKKSEEEEGTEYQHKNYNDIHYQFKRNTLKTDCLTYRMFQFIFIVTWWSRFRGLYIFVRNWCSYFRKIEPRVGYSKPKFSKQSDEQSVNVSSAEIEPVFICQVNAQRSFEVIVRAKTYNLQGTKSVFTLWLRRKATVVRRK